MLFLALGGLCVTMGVLIILRRLRQATFFRAKNRRAFCFYVKDNRLLNEKSIEALTQSYKESEPRLWQLVFSVKDFTPEGWYTSAERQRYFNYHHFE